MRLDQLKSLNHEQILAISKEIAPSIEQSLLEIELSDEKFTVKGKDISLEIYFQMDRVGLGYNQFKLKDTNGDDIIVDRAKFMKVLDILKDW